MPLVQRREPFDDPRWIFELKYDGFRALAYVLGGKPRLVSRNGRDFKRFDDLRDELELEINADAAVLNGEICCLDESGRPLFFDLIRRRPNPTDMEAGEGLPRPDEVASECRAAELVAPDWVLERIRSQQVAGSIPVCHKEKVNESA